MHPVIVYIDGFNPYHSICDLKKPHLKWLDLRSLAEGLLRPGEVLKAVKYFTAYATWLPAPYARHRDYIAALEARGVDVHLGQFKEKPRKCNACNTRWKAHEEKETDVHIATQMVADALLGEVDRLILISADTDLSPPIKMVASKAPQCEVFVAAPPMRKAKCRSLGPKLEITAGRLGKALFPEVCQLAGGQTVTRPADYDPPPL